MAKERLRNFELLYMERENFEKMKFDGIFYQFDSVNTRKKCL